ncbi:replication initiation protein [Gryllotalpicola ginsengisoli]|uniref:replication protein RepA n=1 Tax=Gryllotalpicola ginsengisoli TaxID=444608 RepID=UPI0003B479AA|nr:replication protein RepA [Gryllotalpicola ginsengisoli]
MSFMSWFKRGRSAEASTVQQSEPTRYETGFVKLMIMFGIPVTDPAEGDGPPPRMIVRGNWQRIVTLRPDEFGYPYGTIPRKILLWLAGRARETGSRTVDLGATPEEFTAQLGLAPHMAREVVWQTQRLFGAQLTLGDGTIKPGTPKTVTLRVAEEFRLWNSHRGSVTLAELLWRSISEHPSPVDWEKVRDCGLSAIAMDFYAWLNLLAVMDLDEPQQLSWARLEELFGHQLEPAQFRTELEAAVAQVGPLVPQAEVGLTDRGLTVGPA